MNLSARGSFGLCKDPPPEGMRLEIYITIPFGTGKRIRYSAQVVRVERGPNTAVALMFDTARPVFSEELSHAPTMLSTEPKAKLCLKMRESIMGSSRARVIPHWRRLC